MVEEIQDQTADVPQSENANTDNRQLTFGEKLVGLNFNPSNDDRVSKALVPFQIAYAVSIHKAQGLEYNSVKIVITNEVEEKITHNIFYTAITRAKEKLKIF